MSLNHNQMAYAAIISTLIFGSLFVGISGFYQTSSGVGDFDSAAEEDINPNIAIQSEVPVDNDEDVGDGLPDILEESQYGTDPNDIDTDDDGMSDGWEVKHGLNPLDNGEADNEEEETGATNTADDAEVSNESDSWPDPNQGKYGDPDNDGLTNEQEAELGTDPQRADSDNDGLHSTRWRSLHPMATSRCSTHFQATGVAHSSTVHLNKHYQTYSKTSRERQHGRNLRIHLESTHVTKSLISMTMDCSISKRSSTEQTLLQKIQTVTCYRIFSRSTTPT